MLPAGGLRLTLPDELQDWNQLGRYHEDNLRLQKMPATKGRGGLQGGIRITDGWDLGQYSRVSPM